jgi:hypothetical protein
MKKTYSKPVLDKRAILPAVTAQTASDFSSVPPQVP